MWLKEILKVLWCGVGIVYVFIFVFGGVVSCGLVIAYITSVLVRLAQRLF